MDLCVALLSLTLIVALFSILGHIYHKYYSDKTVQLFYKNSTINSYLMKNCATIQQSFCPPFWCRSPHLLTMLRFIIHQQEFNYDREYIEMPDKGVVSLDWIKIPGVPLKKSSAILIVFPGFLGTVRSVGGIAELAAKSSIRVVVFNCRGCGGTFLTTPKFQSFGDPTDVRQTVLYIKQRNPKSSIVAMANGSNTPLLFSYLGEYGSSSQLKAAVFVSPIYETKDAIYNPSSKLYVLLFLLGLKYTLLRHSKSLVNYISCKKAFAAWKLSEFIDIAFCSSKGTESLDEFLDRNDPMRDVDDISTPVLCINSKDDPISKQEKIPYDIFQFYPNMLLVSTNYGGYCGFIENTKPISWADRLTIDYFKAMLQFTNSSNN